jgi:hypothetical protein
MGFLVGEVNTISNVGLGRKARISGFVVPLSKANLAAPPKDCIEK